MNNYLKLIEASTSYATRMSRLRNRIFGDIASKSDERSKKVVKLFQQQPIYKMDSVVNYYPRHREAYQLINKLRDYGLFCDEHLNFKDEMKRLRTLRGKVKTKKGSGKQALNR